MTTAYPTTAEQRRQPYTDETLNRHKLAAMLSTNHSVTLIAALSCFSTRAYFYKQFRRHFQMTPTEYRQLHPRNSSSRAFHTFSP